jgi:hypothetical protein
MFRRSAVSAFALALAFALGMMLSNRPATVSAQPQPAPASGKCVGMAVNSLVIFRAFEDGTIEARNMTAGSQWHKVDKD